MIFKSILIVVSIIQFSVCHPVSSDVPYCQYEYDGENVKFIAIDCKGHTVYNQMCNNLLTDETNGAAVSVVTFKNCEINDISGIIPNVEVNITKMVFETNNTFPNADFTFADGLSFLVVSDSVFKTTPASLQIEASDMKWFEYNGKNDEAVNSIAMVDPTKLEYFSLEKTSVSRFSDDFFKNATNLKIFRVPSNKFESMDSVHWPNSVKWLDVSMNNISHLSNKSFENVEHLQMLALINNSINAIEPGTFLKLNDLNYLSFEDNYIAEIKKGMFDGLSNIRGMDLSFNKIENIEDGAFEVTPNLNFLYLMRNNISHVSQNTFNGLHHLKHLNLVSNPIENIPVETFANMSQLKELLLNYCELKSFDFNVFASAWNLVKVDLSNNKIEHLVKMSTSQPIKNNVTSQSIFRVMNKFDWMDPIRKFAGKFTSKNAKEIFDVVSYLDFMMNSTSFVAENETNADSWKLKSLDLMKNELTVVEKDIFAAFKNLNDLYLSQNPITTLYPESFAGLAELETLKMDGCKLSSIDFGVFAHSPKLKFLDLSHNQLATIVAAPMPSMEKLYMNDNQLTTLPLQMKDLPKLKTFDVEDNKLECSAIDTFNSIQFECNKQE